MASYIYSRVQEAIGGKSASTGFQKNWSPNRIRALYIMRDFIMVVDYLSGPKLIPIDSNLVGLDLKNPNRVGSLNNLLSSRQLSCLEEIYADEAFSRFPNVLDLQAYANSVINSASRLRYYAYTSGISGEELKNAYRQAYSKGLVDFTYAKNIGGIRYVDTGNTDWYKKHNLRPQYYGPDADRGALAVWFNKVEKLFSEVAAAEAAKAQLSKDHEYILKRVTQDVASHAPLLELRNLVGYCKKSDYDLRKCFVSAVSDAMQAVKPIPGLSKELVLDVVKPVCDKDPANLIKDYLRVVGYYENMGLLNSCGDFDLQKLESSNLYPEETGFLQLGNLFDRILAIMYEKYGSNPMYKYAINIAVMNSFSRGVPEGHLAKRLSNRVRTLPRSPKDYVGAYMLAFYSICGVTADAVK